MLSLLASTHLLYNTRTNHSGDGAALLVEVIRSWCRSTSVEDIAFRVKLGKLFPSYYEKRTKVSKDQRISELTDKFESAWKAGQRPSMDKFLADANIADDGTINWQTLRETFRELEQELQKKHLPKRIGNYELLEKIGQGGMGEVYRARQVVLDRIDVVKVVKDKYAEEPEVVERFKRELKLIGKLSHPNIVRAYGTEEIDGKLLLIMEFIEGESLQQIVASGKKVPVNEALEIIRDVAIGLQYAL